MARHHFLAPLLRTDPTTFALRNERNGRLIAETISTAFDSRSRRHGLLGRDELPHFTALVIAPCNAIHTWFMRFAIDVIFADRAGRIVGVAHAVKPWRMRVSLRAFAVVELPEGATRRADARAGDRLTLVPADRKSDVTPACCQPLVSPAAAAFPSSERERTGTPGVRRGFRCQPSVDAVRSKRQ